MASATRCKPLPPAKVLAIDVLPLAGNDVAAKRTVVDQISRACRDHGFFYVSNHGIDVEKLCKVTRDFHTTITEQEKRKLAIRAYNPDSKNIRSGYSLPIPGKKAVENLCFLNPSFTPAHPAIKAGIPMHEVNKWPDEKCHPGFRGFQTSFYWSVFDLSLLILRGMALALGKPERFFDQYLRKADTLSSVVLIRYPHLVPYPPVKVAQDGTKLSFEWHQDVSLITVLYQSNVQNLQVLTKLGYQDILANNKCFLVNCGTYMEYATKGYFFAPKHRVKWVNEERQSIPFFANLGQNSRIKPFTPQHEDRDTEEGDSTIAYGDYLRGNLQALIKKNGQT